mmetsp:Transcript_32502/g.32230  ORF Transcript_32502/g.32230 Transcript_32502/m.32230 type:complete len:893 (+) Transcript_32502:457-3135(+)
MDKFKQDMEDYGISIAMHTIGFSGDHDANLLTKLSQSGTRKGSFQYVPPNGRIPVAVNNVYDLAFESTTWARFISHGGNTTHKIDIEKDDESGNLKGLIYISENDLEECKIEVHRGSNVMLYDLDPHRGEISEFKDLVLLVTNFVSNKIIQILEVGGDKAAQKLVEIRPLIQEMETRIDYLENEAKKLRPFHRKQCIPFFSTTRELLQNYYTTLRESAGVHLSNIQLASLNNLAHKNILKRNLERKIAREVGKNIDMLNESEKLIGEIVQGFNKDELEKKYKGQLEKYGECVLSTRNWLEAIIDGDCFCATFELERPQNLLGDALEIKIKKMNTTVITSDSFVDSALFETKAGQIIQAERAYQHGMEPKPASNLVKGLPNEIINGVMPIYINEDHWQIARLRIKPMIAWDITVDVLGYMPIQIFLFPFSIFVRVFEDAESEFQTFQFELIKDTCLAIYRDNRDQMIQHLQEWHSNYLSNPASRLPENISSNSIFLAQLFCAYVNGDFPQASEIFPYVFEEEFRRRISMKKDIPLHDFAMKMLGIKMEDHLAQVKAELFGVESHYAQVFHSVQSTASTKMDIETPTGGAPAKKESKIDFEFTGRITELSQKAQGFIERIHQNMNKGGMLYRTLKPMGLFNIPPYTTLDSAGLTTNEQKLALIFQSLRDKKNSDRKDAFSNGTYIDIFNPDQALAFIQKVYTQTVIREAQAYRNQIITEMNSKQYEQRSIEFACTTNLEEAAGCLYGVKQGSSEFKQFYRQLMLPHAQFAAHKLKMLTHGEYQGVKLVLDTLKSNKLVTWIPKDKVFHKIWFPNVNKTLKEDWIAAIPSKAEHIEHKYLRMNGVFVAYTKPRSNVKDPKHWAGKSKVKKSATGTSSSTRVKKQRKAKPAAGKKW